MKLESMPLQQFIDNLFDHPHTVAYQRPQLTRLLANKVGDWYPVSVPGAVMIYRYSRFNNIDEGYATGRRSHA